MVLPPQVSWRAGPLQDLGGDLVSNSTYPASSPFVGERVDFIIAVVIFFGRCHLRLCRSASGKAFRYGRTPEVSWILLEHRGFALGRSVF